MSHPIRRTSAVTGALDVSPTSIQAATSWKSGTALCTLPRHGTDLTTPAPWHRVTLSARLGKPAEPATGHSVTYYIGGREVPTEPSTGEEARRSSTCTKTGWFCYDATTSKRTDDVARILLATLCLLALATAAREFASHPPDHPTQPLRSACDSFRGRNRKCTSPIERRLCQPLSAPKALIVGRSLLT